MVAHRQCFPRKILLICNVLGVAIDRGVQREIVPPAALSGSDQVKALLDQATFDVVKYSVAQDPAYGSLGDRLVPVLPRSLRKGL